MKPLDDPKNWLPLKEAAYLLHVSRRTIVRLCEETDPTTRQPFLCGWRPSPGTFLVSRPSLESYCAATQTDPEFWEQRGKRIMRPRPSSSSGPVRARKPECHQPSRGKRPKDSAVRRRRLCPIATDLTR